MFKNKILLITGETGSFGNAVLDRFLDTKIITEKEKYYKPNMLHIIKSLFDE